MDEVLEFVLAVKSAHREINRRFAEILRPVGVSVVQAEAILVLADGGPMSIKDLGGQLLAEAGNPSRLTDRLAAAGLVDRRHSPQDGRVVQVRLTAAGRRTAEKIRRARQPLLDWGRGALDGQGLTVATTVLQDLVAHTNHGTFVGKTSRASQPPSPAQRDSAARRRLTE